jgi:hypothetical protein
MLEIHRSLWTEETFGYRAFQQYKFQIEFKTKN